MDHKDVSSPVAAPSAAEAGAHAPGDDTAHGDLANAIRFLAMDAVEQAKSGHPGMPMGMADVATVLYRDFLRFDAAAPDWPDRDRFVLSAGHGSMLLYALLYLTGYPDMPVEELKRFRQLGSKTPGHPEFDRAGGIETTTGPLGQGFGNAVGMALAERLLAARFGDGLVDHWTYVIAGDGCLMEGISHEAASLAGHLRLGKLVVLYDDNEISIDGPTSLALSDDALGRFDAYHWHTQRIDGHDPAAIRKAIEAARADQRPSLIACRTRIGFGAPTKEGTAATHGAPLGAEEIAGAREKLGWPHAAFEVPEPVLSGWRAIGARGQAAHAAWRERLAAVAEDDRREFERRQAGELPGDLEAAFAQLKAEIDAERPTLATRQSSQRAIEAIAGLMPELLGGSADLTGSNNTKAKAQQPVAAPDYSGSYVHYGVREHAMAAAMNGLSLHGGFRPYGGTFLVFTDYCRPSIRLSALMKQPVVYVMTHDSIGLGEDGPTHQPVEHLAALRAIPNLRVMRPADTMETAECWQLALERRDGPSVLSLTRQALPTVRGGAGDENWCRYGAYILTPAHAARQVTLIASGSEVAVALKAQEQLRELDIAASVISMPCWDLFAEQPSSYRDEVLYPGSLQVAIEAGVPFGWERWIGLDGVMVGMKGFGASAPHGALYEHFGLTPEAVVAAVRANL